MNNRRQICGTRRAAAPPLARRRADRAFAGVRQALDEYAKDHAEALKRSGRDEVTVAPAEK
ncbi:MAG TPA: hypothetical protein VFC54_14610 [Pseudolabrys sp.]|nr:hypothetical protein [Pseudolabrys sp.]